MATAKGGPPATREMFWDGPASKRRGGDTHYLAFVLGGDRYALGGVFIRGASAVGVAYVCV